jgi:hypothetical protein
MVAASATAIQKEEEKTREQKLSQHLINHGVLLSAGEASLPYNRK